MERSRQHTGRTGETFREHSRQRVTRTELMQPSRSSVSFGLMGDFAVAAAADKLQAQLLRRHLSNERAAAMNEAVTSRHLQEVSYLRRRVLRLENGVREINRLIAALDKRFPDEEARRRA